MFLFFFCFSILFINSIAFVCCLCFFYKKMFFVNVHKYVFLLVIYIFDPLFKMWFNCFNMFNMLLLRCIACWYIVRKVIFSTKSTVYGIVWLCFERERMRGGRAASAHGREYWPKAWPDKILLACLVRCIPEGAPEGTKRRRSSPYYPPHYFWPNSTRPSPPRILFTQMRVALGLVHKYTRQCIFSIFQICICMHIKQKSG